MKNFVFDIGNVSLSFQPKDYLYSLYCINTANELLEIIFKSPEWLELDKGILLIEDVIDILSKKHPELSEEITFVLRNWTELMVPMDKNVDIALKLKKHGYSIYLLSNFHKEAIDTVFKKYNFFNQFDGQVISSVDHYMKPNLDIYTFLLEKYHLDAKETLFIDDTKENIDACEKVGITGVYLPYLDDLSIPLAPYLKD